MTQSETQGEKLWAVMKRRKQTNITALAVAANIDRAALTNIVNNEIGLGRIRAERLAKALGVEVSEVLLQKPHRPKGIERRLQAIEGDLSRLHENLLLVAKHAGAEVDEQPPQARPRKQS